MTGSVQAGLLSSEIRSPRVADRPRYGCGEAARCVRYREWRTDSTESKLWRIHKRLARKPGDSGGDRSHPAAGLVGDGMSRNAVTNASGPSQEPVVVIRMPRFVGAGNRHFSPGREYIPVGERSEVIKRLVPFLAVVAALLLLAPAWRWTPLQDWLSPQRGGADFIGRFFLVGRVRAGGRCRDCRCRCRSPPPLVVIAEL